MEPFLWSSLPIAVVLWLLEMCVHTKERFFYSMEFSFHMYESGPSLSPSVVFLPTDLPTDLPTRPESP